MKPTPPLMTLQSVSDYLIHGLAQKLGPECRDTLWTRAVKDVLGDLGKNQLEYLVCCSGCEFSGQGEWLLDLIWMDRKTWAITLAVESEWGNIVAIREDFGKLLCIKAPQKLMLVNTISHKGSEEIRSALSQMLRAYPNHLSGEEYLLLECTDVGAYRYLFRASAEGPTESAQWEEIPGSPVPWHWRTQPPGP